MATIQYLSVAGATELINKVKTSLATKTDTRAGYDLSKNDLTDALKANYDTAYTHSQADHAPANAEHNTIVGIKVNGVAVTLDATRIAAIATATKVSDLVNDSHFQTGDDVDQSLTTALAPYSTTTQVDSKINTALSPYSTTTQTSNAISTALLGYYTKTATDTAIATAVAGAGHILYEVVQTLPTANIKTNTIYLMLRDGGAGQVPNDIYNEYMYINNKWEQLGNTAVDFSDYSTTTSMNQAIADAVALCVKYTDMTEITASEIDAIFAA